MNGDNIPHSDHYPPHPEISNKDFYFAVVCYTGGNSSRKKWIEPIVFFLISGNPIFSQIFGHQTAENEARNTKMYRGQETHPISVNAKYEMNWANSFFSKVPETPFSAKYLATRGPKIEARNTKMNRDQEIHPIRVNARYEMNWANIFSKSSGNLLYRRTDGRTDIGMNPVYPHSTFGGAGYNDNVYRKPPSHCRIRRATYGTFHGIKFDMVSGLPFIMRANRHWPPFIVDTWHIGTWMGEIKQLRNIIGRWDVWNTQTVWKNKK